MDARATTTLFVHSVKLSLPLLTPVVAQGFPAGAIALLRAYPTPAPDGCTLVNQVRSAELASAVAVIIHNEATRTILSRGRILNPNAGYLDGT
jgi:hypothetical protein